MKRSDPYLLENHFIAPGKVVSVLISVYRSYANRRTACALCTNTIKGFLESGNHFI